MYTIHEGEIIFKEQYGSSPNSRYYVKPPEQENIATVVEEKRANFFSAFIKIFLPQGYPDSVSSDYLSYQIWDTAQAFCSTITGTLATKEVLKGVGVGDTNATPLAATIAWVLKDGCGHIGKILFSYSHGTYLDAYSKKWRLYADTLNDAAMCIELALPVFKDHYTLVLCITTVMKSIVGVAGGASRAAMTSHHAIRGNRADVSAKDSAQETAVNLLASIVAIFILTVFGDSLIIFAIMVILHIVFNYFAVRAVCVRTLNEPRFLEVIGHYLKHESITSPCEINKTEPLMFYQFGSHLLDVQLCGLEIKSGYSIKQLMKKKPKASYLKDVQEVYESRNYILLPDLATKSMYVVLRDKAITNDMLCAYFHAVIFSVTICVINDVHLDVYKNPECASRPFAQICATLQQANWAREETIDINAQFNFKPSIELMAYIDKIAQNEWPRIKTALTRTGWNLRKHLLIIDEWRLSTAKIVTKSISEDDLHTPDPALLHLPKVITFDDARMPDFVTNTDCTRDTFTIEPEMNVKLNKPTIDSRVKADENNSAETPTAKHATS